MALASGTRLGPYEISAWIGAGGMGEVYRGRDTRLGRTVAIKILPESFGQDPERLRRFEQEARAVAALNHPNILTLYDVGATDGTHYLVGELLEGETLRVALERGALRPRRTAEIARDVASALAAAHARGIVHRDLKPENVFLTREGRAKVLDFGLAKLAPPDAGVSESPTATRPGALLGTVGYMSPEQVRGQEADARSDIFAFGSVLYEMLAGRRAFKGESSVETMNAILKEDPPELPSSADVPAALDRLVRHCLEKDPSRRHQSAQDLAFDLEGISGSTPSTSASRAQGGLPRRQWLGLATTALAGSAATAGGLTAAGWRPARADWTSQRLTFRRGWIWNARFASDSATVVYSAAWGNDPPQVFTTRVGSGESALRDLGGPAWLLSVSARDELAVGLGAQGVAWTLARAPLAAGAPRAIRDNVRAADFGPDGETLAVAVVGEVEGRVLGTPAVSPRRIEYPIGQLLYESPSGYVFGMRVSRDGRRVAFAHASYDGSSLWLAEAGRARLVSGPWPAVVGLAWAPDDRRLLFGAANRRGVLEARAADLSGNHRDAFRGLGHTVVLDAQGPRLLVLRRTIEGVIFALAPGASAEQDLAWLDYSVLVEMSRDGRVVLFAEVGEGGSGDQGGGLEANLFGAGQGTIYTRRTDGSSVTRIGTGRPYALSPDGRWVAAQTGSPDLMNVLPTGLGSATTVSLQGLLPTWAWFSLDGSSLIVYGRGKDESASRFFLLPLSGGSPRPLTPTDVQGVSVALSPDGRYLAAVKPDGQLAAYPLAGGNPRALPALQPGEVLIQWSDDGRSLYVRGFLALPCEIFRIELETGRRALWRRLMPADRAGGLGINDLFLTPDGRAHCYGGTRQLDELHLIEGAL